MLFSHPTTNVVPISPRSQTSDERFDAIDRRLDALSAELREMLTITRRLVTIIDGGAQHAALRP